MKKTSTFIATTTAAVFFCSFGTQVAMASGHSGIWTLNNAQEQNVAVASTPRTFLAVDHNEQIWFKFSQLAKQWKDERKTTSSVSDIILAPQYQGIIGMGEQAIPLIVAQLKQEGNDPDLWFWALHAITGESPVAEDHRGNFAKMASDWINWATKEDYAG